MKKTIALIIALALCLCLAACSSGNSGSSNDGVSTGVVGKDLNGDVCIKEKKFGKIIEKVELTPENWKDYIQLFSYDEVTIERDSFGEIISEYSRTVHLLGVKTDRYHTFSYQTAIEFYHKETGERKVCEFYYDGAHVDADFDLNDYEFSRIQGDIYFLNIPEEVIIRTEWGEDHGEATFKVGDSSHARTFHIITATNAIRHWGSAFDQYMD